MAKRSLKSLSGIQVVFKSDEPLCDELKEDLGDWLFQAVSEFFDDNEAPCDISFSVVVNDQDINIH